MLAGAFVVTQCGGLMFHMSPAGPLFVGTGRGRRTFGTVRRRMRQRPLTSRGAQRQQRHDVLRLSSLMCAAKAFTDGRVVVVPSNRPRAGAAAANAIHHLRSYAFGKMRLVFTQRIARGAPGKILAVVIVRESIPAVVTMRSAQLFCRQFVGKYGEQLNYFEGPRGGTRCRFSDHFFASRGALHRAAMRASGDKTCNVPTMTLVASARVIHRSRVGSAGEQGPHDGPAVRGTHHEMPPEKSAPWARGARSFLRRLPCCWRGRAAAASSVAPNAAATSNGHYYAAIYPRYLLFSRGGGGSCGSGAARCLGCRCGSGALKAWGRATNMFHISKILPQMSRAHLFSMRSSRCRHAFVVHCSQFLLPQFSTDNCAQPRSHQLPVNLVFVVNSHQAYDASCRDQYLHSLDASMADMYKMFACSIH